VSSGKWCWHDLKRPNAERVGMMPNGDIVDVVGECVHCGLLVVEAHRQFGVHGWCGGYCTTAYSIWEIEEA